MILGGIILLFTGITPLFVETLISIDSYSSTTGFGLLITIGGLALISLGIASFIVSYGLLKGKGWTRIITLTIRIIAIIFNYFSCK